MLQLEGQALPLPNDYLEYPARAYGMDNPHFDWKPRESRKKKVLTDGTRAIATIIVPLEFFPLNPPKVPFPHPGAVKTPYPDLRHFTVRDYGNRVGVYRLLRAFDEFGVKATFAVNAEVAKRYPPLIAEITKAGHEIAAHGVSTAHIHHDTLTEIQEMQLIEDTQKYFPGAVTWMSPARNQSYRTLGLLAKAGFKICLDWEADNQPIAFSTEHGSIISLPHYGEIGDFKLLIDRSQSDEEWIEQIAVAANYSVEIYGDEGANSFAFTMTPYVLGQPFRIHAVRTVLDALTKIEGLRIATAKDAVAAFAPE